ncbi:hypothetical protein [Botrimarina colliarenosi]|nr:hypothetical protein [Botrimarina colliarenosi]
MLRSSYVVVSILLVSTAYSAPYLVDFSGAVTAVDQAAPPSYWIGERV